jgi:hypothetical protein
MKSIGCLNCSCWGRETCSNNSSSIARAKYCPNPQAHSPTHTSVRSPHALLVLPRHPSSLSLPRIAVPLSLHVDLPPTGAVIVPLCVPPVALVEALGAPALARAFSRCIRWRPNIQGPNTATLEACTTGDTFWAGMFNHGRLAATVGSSRMRLNAKP